MSDPSQAGYEAGLADPETGFLQNPHLFPGGREAAEWWRGFDRARRERRAALMRPAAGPQRKFAGKRGRGQPRR